MLVPPRGCSECSRSDIATRFETAIVLSNHHRTASVQCQFRRHCRLPRPLPLTKPHQIPFGSASIDIDGIGLCSRSLVSADRLLRLTPVVTRRCLCWPKADCRRIHASLQPLDSADHHNCKGVQAVSTLWDQPRIAHVLTDALDPDHAYLDTPDSRRLLFHRQRVSNRLEGSAQQLLLYPFNVPTFLSRQVQSRQLSTRS